MSARRWLFLLPLAALAPLAAQQPAARGRIEGEVTDSVHHKPLAGALITATRTVPEPALFGATTDERGRYRLDTLPAGSYQVTLVAPFLDSIGVSLPPRDVVLGAGERRSLDLATPSGATLRGSACPGVQLAPGRGAISGEVIDADTERPLPGARLVVVWRELSVDRATMRVESPERSVAVTTNSTGGYLLCGVPTGTPLMMQVQLAQIAGSPITLTVDDSLGRRWRPLSLSLHEARSFSDTVRVAGADTVRPRLLTGTATLLGVVRGLGGGPVGGAHVRVADAAPSTVTDSLGRFELRGLPAGTQVAEIRKLGYSLTRAAVELRRGQPVSTEVELTRTVSLDTVRILALRARYAEFEHRRRTNVFGRFMDTTDVESRHPFETSDLLKMVSGMRVERDSSGEAVVVSTRSVSSALFSQCNVNVVIDGIPNMSINMVTPNNIAGMEIYSGEAGLPPQYAGLGGASCGAVIIWTKR